MYLVKIFDGIEDKDGLVIHSPYINETKLSSGVVNQVLNAVDNFTFSINLNNPGWNKINPMRTLVQVIDLHQNRSIFRGRVLKPQGKMYNDGHFNRTFESESILAYLRDSIQRHAEIRDTTVREFFELIIDNHNRQVEPHKRFKVGNVTVTNTTDNVYRYLGYEDTFETIKDKLIDRLGGYLVLREEEDGNYLDYLEDIGEDIDTTPIRLAHNLQNMSYEINPTDVITRLVPLGARIESEDEEAIDISQARLTIAEVNNGIDYLDDLELQKEFSIIEKTIIWDDVTTPQRLLTNAQNFLRNQKAALTSYSVSATNLKLIDLDIDTFEIGNRHPLINPILGVNERVQVIEKQTDILNPQKSMLIIGDKHRTLSQYQNDLRRSQQSVVDLRETVERQNLRITNIRNEIKNVTDELNVVIDEIGNIPGLESAISNLIESVDALTDAVDAIPIYEPATHETDGLMSSLDKQKLDQLENYEVATETEDGLMSASDKLKLNLINISNQLDLDDVVFRIGELERKVDELTNGS